MKLGPGLHFRNLKGTEKSCLAETSYHMTFRKVYSVVTGTPLI